MSVADLFSTFLGNLVISNSEEISNRYGEITAAINKKFRDTDSKTANTLQVGSFGRRTAIDGISDLDMLYLMPKTEWDNYKNGEQSKLLGDIKQAIATRYPNTDIRVDRLVVCVTYTNFHVEVQPVFEQYDGSFLYPDTKNGGSWKTTKPKEEMKALYELDQKKNYNLKPLCKMVRAWKNKHGVEIGGLLIDTLAYNFMLATDKFNEASYKHYDNFSIEFFTFLSALPEQNHFMAPGSNQQVKVKTKFQNKAAKALKLSIDAKDAAGTKSENKKWKKVFGRPFPVSVSSEIAKDARATTWRDTEEFIEDKFSIDIRYNLTLECRVKQDGFIEHLLSDMIKRRFPLLARKSLDVYVSYTDIPSDCKIFWKVLNRGEEAKKRDCIRGQIIPDKGKREKSETTDFIGDHIVECYAVKDRVVVATDRIHVPIVTNG